MSVETTPDPLVASLREQLTRLGAPLPDALLDIARETIDAGGESFTMIRPADWDELRHQEGAEGRGAPYWALRWPAGSTLADRLAERDLAGKRVLELGCGLGLPSLVAARRGATVLATDGAPEAVVFAAHNLALNDLEGEVAVAGLHDADQLLAGAPYDLVIAADVLYLKDNVEALLRLLPRLGPEALIADPSRAGGKDFVASARRIFALGSWEDPERERVLLHTLRARS